MMAQHSTVGRPEIRKTGDHDIPIDSCAGAMTPSLMLAYELHKDVPVNWYIHGDSTDVLRNLNGT
jgi:hypothetical protein